MNNEPNEVVQRGSIRTRTRVIAEPIKIIRKPTMPTIKEELETKEELMALYNYATAEKFNILLIDTESSDMKYRKNFMEFLE